MSLHVKIIGVLNTTPDSFHDGGRFTTLDAGLSQAEKMIADGADFIEIGGESSGPGSQDVPLEEERERVLPLLKAILKRFPDAQIAVDTCKAALAAEAFRSGAMMINDVTAGRGDPTMFRVIADVPAGHRYLVLMYAKDPSVRTTVQDIRYDNVVSTISGFLRERADAAIAAGIPRESIILDPGLGHFVSSDPSYSFAILRRLAEFKKLGFPLLLSPSRKSFLAGSEKLPTAERLPATIAASAIAVQNGASFIRTHDVAEVRRGCEVGMRIASSEC